MNQAFRSVFLSLTIAAFVAQLTELALFFLPGKIIDSARFGNENIKAYTSFLLIAIFGNYFLTYSRWKINIKRLYYSLRISLGMESLTRIMSLPLHRLAYSKKHHWLIIKNGESAITSLTEKIFFFILPLVFYMSITTTILLWIDPVAVCIMIVGIILLLIVSFTLNWKIMPELDKAEQEENTIMSEYNEVIENAWFVVLNNKENSELSRFVSKYGIYKQTSVKMWLKQMLHSVLRDTCISFATLAVIVFRATNQVLDSEISLGNFITVVLLSVGAFRSMNEIGLFQRDLLTYVAQIRSYIGLQRQPKRALKESTVQPIVTSGRIVFENVKCRAPLDTGENWTLEIENFSIEQGETIHIVGPSGAGKSTLISLLLGIRRPAQGRILFDGHDINTIDNQALRKSIGYVEQVPTFLNRTIAENLRFALSESEKAEMTDDKLYDILDRVHLSSVRHKKRLHTPIGRKGENLSVGERQRLALARALIINPSILIFDEPTSALDPYSEVMILAAMRREAVGRTCIVITHKVSSLVDAQKILVLNHGEVVGVGTHADLSTRCQLYMHMVLHGKTI